jgi:predicted transcriptional regulator
MSDRRPHPSNVHPAAALLDNLAARLIRLAPSHRDPERFHVEKDDLVRELHKLASALRREKRHG